MIQTRDLTKAFGTNSAVENLTVSFPAGTVTALLGLNGAGKTTLLWLLAGLIDPDGGDVAVCGRVPGGRPYLLAAHLGPAAMNPRHTVERHLAWLAALAGVGAERVDEVLAAAELTDRRRTRIRALSLGARQRVAIAGALLCRPRVLLFDEPLNGLDVPGVLWFRGLVRELADGGCTVVIASHLLAEVVLTAERVVLLQRGRLRMTGALHDLVPAGAEPRQWLESALTACA